MVLQRDGGGCPIAAFLHMAAHRAVCCRRKKKWNGPLQYEDESGELMMLPTDLVSPPGSGGTQSNENRQSCWHILVQLCTARLSLHGLPADVGAPPTASVRARKAECTCTWLGC